MSVEGHPVADNLERHRGFGFERVRFGRTEDAYDGFNTLLRGIVEWYGCQDVLDVGGGAQPQFSVEYLSSSKVNYTVLDISEEELAQTASGYRKMVMDIGGELRGTAGAYDFVFSRFVLEHVGNAHRAHANVFALLKPGGIAVHFFPTLFALPFVVNKLVPESLSVRMLSKERQAKGKFPAYYRWCVGPTEWAIRRLERVGYEVLEYAGFFGHGYYDGRPALRRMHGKVRGFLLKHPIACCTSFAWVILRKPAQVGSA